MADQDHCQLCGESHFYWQIQSVRMEVGMRHRDVRLCPGCQEDYWLLVRRFLKEVAEKEPTP